RESSPKAVVTPTGLAPYVKNLMDDLTEQNPVRFDPVVVADADYLPGHALNVSGLAACMALNSQYRNLAPDLAQAGLLADLGMVTVADIAQRPQESWTEAEAAAVKAHPKVSLQLMDRSSSAHVKAAVSRHHERMDGSAYPRGSRAGWTATGPARPAAARTPIPQPAGWRWPTPTWPCAGTGLTGPACCPMKRRNW